MRLLALPRLFVLAAAFLAAVPAAAQVSINALGTPVTQDFNSLASSGTSSSLPAGWLFVESGTNANATYSAGTGSSTAGDTYSFGTTGDRAFGGLQSGSLIPTIGASFLNNTGATINSLAIAYTGEQWRLGATGRVDRLDFQYSTTATSLTTGTWLDVNALDFTAPTTGPSVGAVDGNAAANRTAISFTVTGLNIPSGATFWIRWTDFNATGSDDGLAVDDFSLTADGVVTTNPSGSGNANPSSILLGASTLLSVSVTPGSGPTSSGLAVKADLSSIGGSATQDLADDGTHTLFTFNATPTIAGVKSLPVTISDDQGRSAATTIALSVVPPPTPSTTVVISQVYGGGGNSGAQFTNDFVEIFNLGTTTVNLAGWSVQYQSSAGAGTWQVTSLTGSVLPGQFYLVQEAVGANPALPLPTPDAAGTIAMAAGAGKVALVNGTGALSGGCPVAIGIVDFVGYGSAATCSETSPTATLSNTTAAIRHSEFVDSNNNSVDFDVAAPNPRNSAGSPPTGVGASQPAAPGEQTRLTVKVTPGAFPTSGGITVTGNLSSLGGPPSQTFFDDGSTGDDQTAGDNVFTFLATVPGDAPFGIKNVPVTVSDALGRSTTASINVVVAEFVAIHDIQGSGLFSPYAGQLVTTHGIVTARKFNGFFIQAPDAEADANPATSEGIFVFTGGLPSVSVGDLAKVGGTVSEFAPPSDPVSPPSTELSGSLSIAVLASSQPVPAPVTLTAADTYPAPSFDQLERFEGMRVRIPALRVVAPTQGTVNETDATSFSNGVFYGVVDGVPRPFHEPGVAVLDPLPGGSPCCVPRFDLNPERFRIDSDGQPLPDGSNGPKIEVNSGALLSEVIGPLEFAFRTWAISPDPASPPVVSNLGSAVPVPVPSENEFTIGAFNMERFFDTIEDPNVDDVVLTPTAFANRLNKASLAIRNVMRMPDILGVEEMENLQTLQSVAAKINGDETAAGHADPGYVAYLEEGNDIGGIDSGFLVKSSRVHVVDVTQVGKAATYTNPNTGEESLLNDRPPLVLRATVQGPVGAPFPVTVIVNHLRSLNGVEDPVDSRVRVKKAKQAEFLASLIQGHQTAGERVVSVGDYNAFAVNDGYVDVIGTVKGTPTPVDQVVQASPDLVTPDLTNLVDLVPAEQGYSYSFDGNIQTLDHVIVTGSMLKRYSRFHVARNDADFPESYRGDANRPERISDHDMPVGYFAFPGAPTLNLLGPNPQTVECCTSFADPGATASDSDLGDLTSQIQVSGSVDTHAIGSYVLTYSVSNGFLTTTQTRTVNVVDTTPPVLTLNGGSSVTLELGDPYVELGATATDACNTALGAIQISGSVNTGVVGSYPVVYTVSDGYNTTKVTRAVHVVDTTAPHIDTLTASPHVLWPPNGQFVPVVVSVSASDASGTPTCRITDVANDESVSGFLVTGALTLNLRAERDGRGQNGRIYTITVTCRDASGNAGVGKTTVIVPHDQGR